MTHDHPFGGCSSLSLVMFLRDKEGEGALMTTTTTSSLRCPTTMIQGVVGSGCDGCSLLSLVLFSL
jgi:hypothetical protein